MAKNIDILWKVLFILALHLLLIVPAGRCHAARENPFGAKASLLRFWQRVLPTVNPPAVLMEKASPLNATWLGVFGESLKNHTLPDHIATLCALARLLCPTANSSDAISGPGDSDFHSYHGKQFKEYSKGGSNSFKNYSHGDNVVKDDFKRYGRDSNRASQAFGNYAADTNVEDEGFATYGTGSNAASADFSSYGSESNLPGHSFTTYGAGSNAGNQSFKTYGDNANVGSNLFAAYGKDANGLSNGFSSYADNSNVINNSFKSYTDSANGAAEQFSNYAGNGNVPDNDFESYGARGNAGSEGFTRYAQGSNQPHDIFKSYGKQADTPLVTFTNYGNSSNTALDEFKGYGKGSNGAQVRFKSYGPDNKFSDYAKKGVAFSDYSNSTNASLTPSLISEAGKFFREKLLVQGSSLPLPNLRDPLPPRSFLPRCLADGLPFASQNLSRLLSTFRIPENSSMEGIMANTLAECERAPVKGETKKCVASVEAMAEFAVSILGSNVDILTTSSTAGSGEIVDVGSVRPKHGGEMTRSVSCHQSLFPYLVYYCHSVPLVKVYEADLLDHKSKDKINDGVAICHMDTSQWSATHAAFLSLGPAPGRIEVCHWIFQNDLIWVPSN